MSADTHKHAPGRLERLLLVLDYDGTVTVDECNEIVLQRFTGDAWRPLEAQALDGTLTHAECFRRQFALVRAPREELFDAMADLAEPAPGLADFLEWARAGGARIAVVSVGFREAIERVWELHALPAVDLYASELRALPEGEYTVVLDDLFGDCPRCGPGGCKGAALRALREVGDAVAVFGDGVADLCLAREADVVFARGVLGDLCAAEGIAYHSLTDFENARALLDRWIDDKGQGPGGDERRGAAGSSGGSTPGRVPERPGVDAERGHHDGVMRTHEREPHGSRMSSQTATRERLRGDALQFGKFALVGASGVIVNLAVFSATLLVWLAVTGNIDSGSDVFSSLTGFVTQHAQDVPRVADYVANALGFVVSVMTNYYLNRRWTFRSTGRISRELPKFVTVSLVAYAANLVVFTLARTQLELGPVASQLIAIAVVFPINFVANKLWSFRHATGIG